MVSPANLKKVQIRLGCGLLRDRDGVGGRLGWWWGCEVDLGDLGLGFEGGFEGLASFDAGFGCEEAAEERADVGVHSIGACRPCRQPTRQATPRSGSFFGG